MTYRIAEGSLTLASGWQDQSINVLLMQDAGAKGANLVIAREQLPLGMTFEGHVAEQRQTFKAKLDGCEMLVDTVGKVDGRAAHFLEMSWRSEGRPVRQVMVMVPAAKGMTLTFTGTIPGEFDEATRQTLVDAIVSFKFDA